MLRTYMVAMHFFFSLLWPFDFFALIFCVKNFILVHPLLGNGLGYLHEIYRTSIRSR